LVLGSLKTPPSKWARSSSESGLLVVDLAAFVVLDGAEALGFAIGVGPACKVVGRERISRKTTQAQ
jgi:hypothetical protein